MVESSEIGSKRVNFRIVNYTTSLDTFFLAVKIKIENDIIRFKRALVSYLLLYKTVWLRLYSTADAYTLKPTRFIDTFSIFGTGSHGYSKNCCLISSTSVICFIIVGDTIAKYISYSEFARLFLPVHVRERIF